MIAQPYTVCRSPSHRAVQLLRTAPRLRHVASSQTAAGARLTRVMKLFAVYFVLGLGLSTAAESDAQQALLHIEAANTARAQLATEQAQWTAEQQRLTAILATVRAETERLQTQASALATESVTFSAQLTNSPQAQALETAQSQLREAATHIAKRCATLAPLFLPGIIAQPTLSANQPFEDAVLALERSEQAARAVAIDIIPGQLNGQTVAARVLRISSAVAWWAALDQSAAGMVALRNATVYFEPSNDPIIVERIIATMLMFDGRQPSELVQLPVQPLTATQGVQP